MKYTLIAAAFAGLVTAQYTGIPECANPCVNTYLPASCGSDFTCVCTYPGFIDNISCCISKSCDAAGQTQALAAAQQICSGANVPLPSAAGCSGEATASSSAAASGVSASAVSSASSVASSLATVTGSAASSASSRVSSASSVASSRASSVSSSVSSAASVAASSSAALGNRFEVPGVVGAALLGVAALL